MLSRVANSIYWMSRYIERAENVARFVHVNLHLMMDVPDPDQRQWLPLVSVSGDLKAFEQRVGDATEQTVRHFLTFDTENPNSIISCMTQARENARSVREIISSEMWEQVNATYLWLHHADAQRRAEDDPHDFYTRVKLDSHSFCGITDTTMSHNEGWHFARMGRLLERADKTSRIVDVKYFILLPGADDVGAPHDNLHWAALLKSASAYEMYRKEHARITPEHVVQFLVLDLDFPRAIRYCLVKAEESLHQITGARTGTFHNPAEQQLGRLRSELDYTGVDEMIAVGLHEYLDGFQAKLNLVGGAIFETFFALRPPVAQDHGVSP